MLIREKMKTMKLSPAEQSIAEFLLGKAEQVRTLKALDVASETYTSSPAVVRFCHKLGYSGWNEFRDDFYNESVYLNRHFQDLDPNIPFHKGDNSMEIAGRIAGLYSESIEDTMELLDRRELDRAVDILRKGKRIAVFAISNISYMAEEFAFMLERIRKPVQQAALAGERLWAAFELEKDDAAIVLSYSGETFELKRVVQVLHEKEVPYIAVTSVGGNSVSEYASAVLHITTREKSYSKIAGYTSSLSLHLILDILYSCLFERDYSKNLKYKFSRSRVEMERGNSSNAILRENQDYSLAEIIREIGDLDKKE